MDGVTALERSYDQLAKLSTSVGPDQLAMTCPCEGWDVKAMLNHALGAAHMFTLANRGEAVGEGGGDIVGTDAPGAVAETAEANIAAWKAPGALEGDRSFPFGTFPASVALMINVGEIATHAWDLAKATGQDPTLDPEVVTTLFDFYKLIPMDEYRAHGAFGAEVSVPATASEQDRMLGFLGRQP